MDTTREPQHDEAGPGSDSAAALEDQATRTPGGPVRLLRPPSDLSPAHVLSLQRLAGNRGTARMLRPPLQVQRDGDGGGGVATKEPVGPIPDIDVEDLPEAGLHLVEGSRGPKVRKLQQQLNAKGATPPLNPDGIFGPKTRQAVLDFQHGYFKDPKEWDGKVGGKTWQALFSTLETPKKQETPPNPDLQQPVPADQLDAKLKTAVEASQWSQVVTLLDGFHDDNDVIRRVRALLVTIPFPLRDVAAGLLRDAAAAANLNRVAGIIDAATGIYVKTSATEQVGASNYLVQGGYEYELTENSIDISVGMNFHPDSGVTTPVKIWFDHIHKTWNHFSAVDQSKKMPARKIQFKPFEGAGHDIQVSDGTGRANAGHYYVKDDRAPQTIPHEFGHLIGLEDEYERDAADYTRVTGEAPPAGDKKTVDALSIAQEIHDALFLAAEAKESDLDVQKRRAAAVDKVLADEHIVANYNWGSTPQTREVAAQYSSNYKHDMSADAMSQVGNSKMSGWRERVVGTFQYTSTSIMGDMTDHTHPVEPRHVRAFAGYVQKALGGGPWVPVHDH